MNDARSMARTSDCALYLLVDGIAYYPESIEQHNYRFHIGHVSGPVRIRTLTCNPYLELHTKDNRYLGVAVKTIVLGSHAAMFRIGHQSPLLAEGFYGAEPKHRWTDGDAVVPASVLALLGTKNIVIEIEIAPAITYSAERLAIVGPLRGPQLTSSEDHFEGVAYSNDGCTLAVAAAGAGAVLLFSRGAQDRFAATPFRRLGGTDLNYVFVHDVVFLRIENRDYIAAIERRGRVTIWSFETGPDRYSDNLILQFSVNPVDHLGLADGHRCHTDALAVVPETAKIYLAISEFVTNRILFFEIELSVTGSARLVYVFSSRHIAGGDGLAFSACGRWLAVANHTDHSVAIFERRSMKPGEAPEYDPEPIASINDIALRHPHSVAFRSQTNDLVITNSGNPNVLIFANRGDAANPRWSVTPTTMFRFTPDEVFKAVQAQGLVAEGGAKGVAIFGNEIALCSPEMGVQIVVSRGTTSSQSELPSSTAPTTQKSDALSV